MYFPYTLLLTLAMCGGPYDQRCTQEHLDNVREYTMQKCMNIFNHPEKCTELAGNRAQELWFKCLSE